MSVLIALMEGGLLPGWRAGLVDGIEILELAAAGVR